MRTALFSALFGLAAWFVSTIIIALALARLGWLERASEGAYTGLIGVAVVFSILAGCLFGWWVGR